MTHMTSKKLIGTATLAGALGAAALGIGAGLAQADDNWKPWQPDGNHWSNWLPASPGQIKHDYCPWDPPGHWIGGPHGIPCT